ncbi:motility protein A [Dethiobacter alkaliphilus]|uniref:MotA/TolQ/ExbB proton channel n=1 Tax=Dethiobacter alkaliphilus AHT 1 TaxID=555088 RepID=C0GJH3_DETAL|nr:MotA/TolQ/ExbB proton channel family protein [Dethiobacter alkaliphilus]EEG76520.1 MotA/TolQ/ExbB proton channel [Dethiobacter alkaliphilus AHT 1]
MQQRMDFLTILGIGLGLSLVMGAIALGGSVAMFWSLNSIMITVGGSFAALLVNFQLPQITMVYGVTKNAFQQEVQDIGELISVFVDLGQKARREGLLALEDDLNDLEDPFLGNGLQMVIDGLEPELIRDIMDTEITATVARHRMGQDLFKTWGALAPAFGMIGTLIGLIQMLANLDDPSAIGPGMAVALLTTFYGALLANLLFNPLAGKLAIRSDAEIAQKEAVVEGVLAIQAGTNPRILQEKMKAFASPAQREEMARQSETPDTAGEEVIYDHA